MAYNEMLAERVRRRLAQEDGFSEIRMFDGLCFLVNGNMTCGIVDDRLMVRVGAERYEEAQTLPFTRPMDFTGRPMRGLVYVEPEGIRSDSALADWVDRALAFVLTLPPR